MAKVFIDGQAGTTGLMIDRRLARHPAVTVLEIDEALRKDATARAELMNQADVVFLCLPDAAAIQAAQLVTNPNTIVIDASTAHRVNPDWTYGLGELVRDQRAKIASAKRIANPGCYATGFILAVRPLIELKLIGREANLSCHAMSGYSGAGKAAIAMYEAEDRPRALGSPRLYALSLSHKHLPEMRAYGGTAEPPLFSPAICDYYSGMTVTVPLFASQMAKRRSVDELIDELSAYYESHALIHVRRAPDDGFLPANELSGRDDLNLYVTGNDEQLNLIASFDNLGKGASGAAVQNMNLALGLDEYQSLIWGGTDA